MRRPLIVVAVLVTGFLVWHYAHRSGSSISTGELTQQIGAESCTAASYELVSQINNQKMPLYSCTMPGTGTICVDVEGGIARDVTDEARILWQGTLGADRPSCLG